MYVTQKYSSRRVLRYRNADEKNFLSNWIHQKQTSSQPSPREAIPLIEEISACNVCGANLGKKNSYGTGKNGIMVILHAPRLISPEEKRMLKTEAVDLMKKMLGSIGLVFEECYISNIIKCDPDVHEKPSAMYKNCAPFLDKEIRFVKPHTIIVMGQILPLKNLIGSSHNIRWFNIEHPITIIKNPELKKGAWNTLKEVKKHLEGIGEK
jgi:uracil-DNA glycosylase family 4